MNSPFKTVASSEGIDRSKTIKADLFQDFGGDRVVSLVRGFLDLIFPPFCLVCGRLKEETLCGECVSRFSLIARPVCERCGKPCAIEVRTCRECSGRKFYFTKARTLGLYEGTLKETVHKLKYHGGWRLASFLARLMWEKMDAGFFEVDLVTGVPLSARKERERGYNQAYLLAREIAKLTGRPFSLTLKLLRETHDQSKLSLPERRQNVKEAFSTIKGVSLEGQRILLLDDVFTTGSTLNESSKALRKGGADSVRVLAVARSLLH